MIARIVGLILSSLLIFAGITGLIKSGRNAEALPVKVSEVAERSDGRAWIQVTDGEVDLAAGVYVTDPDRAYNPSLARIYYLPILARGIGETGSEISLLAEYDEPSLLKAFPDLAAVSKLSGSGKLGEVLGSAEAPYRRMQMVTGLLTRLSSVREENAVRTTMGKVSSDCLIITEGQKAGSTYVAVVTCLLGLALGAFCVFR